MIILIIVLTIIFTPLYSMEIKFGTYEGDANESFKSDKSNVILIKDVQSCYGWQITGLKENEVISAIETFTLPVAPEFWGEREDAAPYTVSSDRLTATTVVKKLADKNGIIRSRWWSVPGDPIGQHVILVKINNITYEFKFKVENEKILPNK